MIIPRRLGGKSAGRSPLLQRGLFELLHQHRPAFGGRPSGGQVELGASRKEIGPGLSSHILRSLGGWSPTPYPSIGPNSCGNSWAAATSPHISYIEPVGLQRQPLPQGEDGRSAELANDQSRADKPRGASWGSDSVIMALASRPVGVHTPVDMAAEQVLRRGRRPRSVMVDLSALAAETACGHTHARMGRAAQLSTAGETRAQRHGS